MKLTPINGPITETGQYVIQWVDSYREFELIKVVLSPDSYFGGLLFKGFFGISEWGGKSVGILKNHQNIKSIAKIHE